MFIVNFIISWSKIFNRLKLKVNKGTYLTNLSLEDKSKKERKKEIRNDAPWKTQPFKTFEHLSHKKKEKGHDAKLNKANSLTADGLLPTQTQQYCSSDE